MLLCSVALLLLSPLYFICQINFNFYSTSITENVPTSVSLWSFPVVFYCQSSDRPASRSSDRARSVGQQHDEDNPELGDNEQWNNNYSVRHRRRWYHRLYALIRRVFPRSRRRRVSSGHVDQSDAQRQRYAQRHAVPQRLRLGQSTVPAGASETTSLDGLQCEGSTAASGHSPVTPRLSRSVPESSLVHSQFELACARFGDAGQMAEDLGDGSHRHDKNRNLNVNNKRKNKRSGGRRHRLSRRLDRNFGVDEYMEALPLRVARASSRSSTARSPLLVPISTDRRPDGQVIRHSFVPTVDNERCELYVTRINGHRRYNGDGHQDYDYHMPLNDTCSSYTPQRPRSPPPPYRRT